MRITVGEQSYTGQDYVPVLRRGIKSGHQQMVDAAASLIQKYTGMEFTEEYWDSLYEDAKTLYAQSGNHPFMKNMLLAVVKEYERLDKPL